MKLTKYGFAQMYKNKQRNNDLRIMITENWFYAANGKTLVHKTEFAPLRKPAIGQIPKITFADFINRTFEQLHGCPIIKQGNC